MRIILYTGKGGVGKTTVAAATALRCARLGYKTLAISTDPAHSLGDSLDLPLEGVPTPVAEQFWGQELDVYREIDAHWGTLQEWLKAVMAWRGVEEVMAEEMAVLPGMEELSGLLYLLTYHDSKEFDVVIVDCAPTGETLRLLSFPEVMSWWMRRILPFERTAARVVRPIMTRLTDLPIPGDEVFAAGQDLFDKLGRMHEVLTEQDESTIRLVLNPEKMVIKEAQRTFTYLNLYGYATDMVVSNRVLPSLVADVYFERWRESQSRYATQIEEAFSPLPILQAPLMDQEVVGLPMLERFGEELYGDKDPSKVYHHGPVHKIVQSDGTYVFSIPLPFVAKEDIELSRAGDELIVHIGNQKRNIILPRALVNSETKSARLEGNTLHVTFAREGKAKEARR